MKKKLKGGLVALVIMIVLSAGIIGILIKADIVEAEDTLISGTYDKNIIVDWTVTTSQTLEINVIGWGEGEEEEEVIDIDYFDFFQWYNWTFDKSSSTYAARWYIPINHVILTSTYILDLFYIDYFDDENDGKILTLTDGTMTIDQTFIALDGTELIGLDRAGKTYQATASIWYEIETIAPDPPAPGPGETDEKISAVHAFVFVLAVMIAGYAVHGLIRRK